MSCRPGTSISTRSTPCCWTLVSLVPDAVEAAVQHLDRLRHRAADLVGDRGLGERRAGSRRCRSRRRRACGPSRRRARRRSRWFERLQQRRARAARSAGSAMRTMTPRGCVAMPPLIEILPSRSLPRTSSRKASTWALTTEALSTSISICAPPCRSRPSTIWRNGQEARQSALRARRPSRRGRKLGTTSRTRRQDERQDRGDFPGGETEHRVSRGPDSDIRRWRARLRGRGQSFAGVLDRLALGAHLGDAGAGETDLTLGAISSSTSLSSVDLVILPIRPPRGDDDVAALGAPAPSRAAPWPAAAAAAESGNT